MIVTVPYFGGGSSRSPLATILSVVLGNGLCSA